MHPDTVDTPAVIVNLDIAAANISKAQGHLVRQGLTVRPHIKTHKLPEVARMQLAAGAVGITCQKIGEAEALLDAAPDLGDFLLTYNILGESKVARLVALARRTRLSVVADSSAVVAGLSTAFARAGVELAVLVECDTGGARCGVQDPAAAAGLAGLIAAAPGLRFGGLMTYPAAGGAERAVAFMREATALLAQAGIAVPCVTTGGSPDLFTVTTGGVFTEYRPGTYVYNDRSLIARGVATEADCALHVVATVISVPTAHRAVIDAGSKVLTSDLLGLEGFGLVIGRPDIRIDSLSEEHGRLTTDGPIRLAVGDRVRIIPNHVCVVTNMMDQVHLLKDGALRQTPVIARGKVT